MARASACHAEGRGFESLHPLLQDIGPLIEASGAVMATWRSGNAAVCKTAMSEFDSRPLFHCFECFKLRDASGEAAALSTQ